MNTSRDIQRLERILEIKTDLDDCIAKNGITREKILSNRDTRWMVSMPLLDITEQIAALSQSFTSERAIPDFKSIKGMRNRLVHGYGEVDYDYIADAIFDDLPVLVERCRQIIDEVEPTCAITTEEDSAGRIEQ